MQLSCLWIQKTIDDITETPTAIHPNAVHTFLIAIEIRPIDGSDFEK